MNNIYGQFIIIITIIQEEKHRSLEGYKAKNDYDNKVLPLISRPGGNGPSLIN